MASGESSDSCKLDLDVVFCSSEDSFFRADEVCRVGSGVNRGWQSAADLDAPHQLGLRLQGDSLISRLQVISHNCKIASKVEVHVAEPVSSNIKGDKVASYHDAVFRLLGYFSFRRTDPAAARCGELKCISVGCRALYVKLVLHEPHEHPLNIHRQVGIVSAVCLGTPSRPTVGSSLLASMTAAAANAAEMDMMCDASILEKIRVFDNSKRKAIVDEDLESARRINQQVDVMIPLAIQTKSLEQQKEFAIVSNDFDKAQKLKAQIQRIRTFVHSLKVGMPLEDFSLERFDEYVSGQLYRSPGRAKANVDELAAVSKAENEKKNVGASSPSFTSTAGSKGGSSMVLVEDDEVPLTDEELTEHDASMKRRVESMLTKTSSGKNVSIEHVSHARSSRIQGWDDAIRAFGLYFACCLFSKNYCARETAVEIVLSEGFTPFEALAGGSAPFFCTALGSYLASSSYGPQESVQSTLVANVDLICALASGTIGGAAGSASLLRICEALCAALLHRCADSNKKIKEAAVRGLRALVSCPAIGLDRVCSSILDVEVKRNFRILLAKIEFLHAELVRFPDWIDFPSLSFSSLLTAVLKPAVEGVSPDLRARGADLFAVVLHGMGTTGTEIRKALKSLRPSQLAAVEASYGSKILLDGPSESSNRSHNKPAVSPKRRSVQDTLAKEPDLEHVYKFNSRTPQPTKKSGSIPRERARSSSVEPVTEPRVTIAATVEHVPSKRASSIKQKLTGAIRDSRKPSRPDRRTQPDPVPGACQFCHASVLSEHMFDHFMSRCPMLCVCPLCRNPVEVIDVHWHLADDCQFKGQIRQCSTCFNCFKPGEYNQHVAAQSCTPYDHSVIVCPLCQVVMPRDDLFWEDHMLQTPWCEKNPRRPVDYDDVEDQVERTEKGDIVQPEKSPPVVTKNSITPQPTVKAPSEESVIFTAPERRTSVAPESKPVTDVAPAHVSSAAEPAREIEPPSTSTDTSGSNKREWFQRRPAFVARRLHKKANPDQTSVAPDELTSLEGLIDNVHAVSELIHAASEIGSPSDGDLANLEHLKNDLVTAKRYIVDLLEPLIDSEEQVEPNQGDYVEEFFECLVKETDIPEMNRELMNALLTAVYSPWDQIITEKELILVSATDGSLDYFAALLAVPHVAFNFEDVLTACFFNQLVRIDLAWILLNAVDLTPHMTDGNIKSLVQDFFEAIASGKRAIPKERREKRESLLELMVSKYADHLTFDSEGGDCQTVFTRALVEGDLYLTTLLLERCAARIGDVNMVKSDKTTALMQAVLGNSPAVVQLLLDKYGDKIEMSVPDGGAGYKDVEEMAVQLQRNPKIFEVLKASSAHPPLARQASRVEEID